MVIILSKLYYNKKITVKNRWSFLKHTVKGYKNHLKYWLVYEKKIPKTCNANFVCFCRSACLAIVPDIPVYTYSYC